MAADVGSSEFFMVYQQQVIADNRIGSIVVQRFNAGGSNLGMLAITSDADGATFPNIANPDIAIGSATSGVVIYEQTVAAGNVNVILQRFDPSTNTLVGGAITVSSEADSQTESSVVALSNGTYVVVYHDPFSGSGTDTDIRAVIVQADGTVGAQFYIDSNINLTSDPSITALSGGGFAVSYTIDSVESGNIQARTFSATGTQTGSVVVASGANSQNQSAVAATNDGGFVVSWEDDSAADVLFQSFNATAVAQGTPTAIGTTGGSVPTLLGLADGRFLFGYDNNSNIQLTIVDPRSGVNSPAVYTPDDYQIGTIGDDVFTAAFGPPIVHGWDGNDSISDGGDFGDQIFGDEGNDTIIMSGVDTIELADGGNGIDTLIFSGASANTALDLAAGTITNIDGTMAIGNFENVSVAAEVFNYTITGTSTANSITGGGGNDTINSGSGADTVHGGIGDDRITSNSSSGGDYFGDAGNDLMIVGTGFNDLDGGADNDTIDTSVLMSAFSYSINLVTGATAFSGSGEHFFNFENATTGSSNDNITGTAGANIIITGAGNDSVAAGAGNDTVRGGADADTLNGGLGIDTLDYALSVAAVTINLATGAASGGAATGDVIALFENVDGSSNNDSLTGSISANVLSGNDGNDTLNGGQGLDTLHGGLGNDSMVGGSGADSMVGGDGDDIYVTLESGDQVVEGVGAGTDLVQGWGNTTLSANVENLTLFGTALNGTGNALNNVITGNANNNSILGGDGNDTIDGAGGNDILKGEGGNDSILGSVGADTLNGGLGNDTMVGGLGNDLYIVEQVGDVVSEVGGGGVDTVQINFDYTLLAGFENLTLAGVAVVGTGNTSNNLITGNFSNNQLFGDAGNDTINAGNGSDSVAGGTGSDVISGEAGGDTLHGGDQNDTIDGGLNNDTLFGDTGGDVLIGGVGTDIMTGGTGADIFAFDDGHVGTTAATADRITDFTAAQLDQIGLALMDANTNTGIDDAFNFIGINAFTGVAGQLRIFTNAGNTFVTGDVNGDAVGDFLIRVDGLVALNAGSFIL